MIAHALHTLAFLVGYSRAHFASHHPPQANLEVKEAKTNGAQRNLFLHKIADRFGAGACIFCGTFRRFSKYIQSRL
jgi:hypothetical protein